MYYNITMLNSIGNTALVRCREVVRFSEGPLSEARLYTVIHKLLIIAITINKQGLMAKISQHAR